MGEEEGAAATAQYRFLEGPRERAAWCVRAGLAEARYGNGDVYRGHFSQDRLREGNGKYIYAAAAEAEEPPALLSYDGDWVAGTKEGYGVQKYRDGGVFEGFFSAGLRHGQGTMRYSNGDLYSGAWTKDRKHGHGAYVFKEPASQLVGDWKDNEFVRGRWIQPDLTTFYGDFVNGKPTGDGIYYHPNGLAQSGKFVQVAADAEEDEEAESSTGECRFEGGKISRAKADANQLAFNESIEPSFSTRHSYERKVNASGEDEDEDDDDCDDFVLVARNPPRPQQNNGQAEEEEGLGDDLVDVTPEELVEREQDALEELFHEVDTDKNQELDLSELITAVASNQPRFAVLHKSARDFTNTTYAESFKKIDSDKNGVLNLQEFKEYFYLLKLFCFTDRDKSGKVRYGELRDALNNNPELFPPAIREGGSSRIAVSALISAGDRDHDRLLDFDEFVRMIVVTADESIASE